ncbi:MAG: exodeoxyribonuclease I [Sphaerochaetaceae bacterium]|jgi:exodeoxyribonuclease-1|nr:exodeoxyribonuclease I [Sphaerochaetaceae bacterium]HHU88737.1 exodeoxyribonuclease I [Spirochaetales bacterium]
MKKKETFFWYDLETFGLDSRHDRIAQFAGIRTDSNLLEVGEPVILYCRLSDDYLPDPLSCLITHITPNKTAEKGITESDFMGQINDLFSEPNTCAVGYNSLRFDDEFIRNGLFRNFIDPYKREYEKGNSRWDILDLMRAAHDLRPTGIVWPIKENGLPSFKLTDLTEANSISHLHAHDALSDVRATIEMARLVKLHQPNLFKYYLTLRNKQSVKNLLSPMGSPLLLTAAQFTRPEGCSSIVVPLTAGSSNPNSILVFDLREDPSHLINASRAFKEIEQLEKLEGAFRKTSAQLKGALERGEEVESALIRGAELLIEGANLLSNLPQIIDSSSQLLSIKGLHRVAINRSPFLSPLSVVNSEVEKRLNLDLKQAMENYNRIRGEKTLPLNLRKALDREVFVGVDDIDHSLYSGPFFSDADAKRFKAIRETPASKLWGQKFDFDDERGAEMLWRYLCRNWPEELSKVEKERYKAFCAERITQPPAVNVTSLQFFARKIREKLAYKSTLPEDKAILIELEEWGRALCKRLGVDYPTS